MRKHGTRWQDAGMVGVACWVNVTEKPHPLTGKMTQYPTDGGVLTEDNEPCASCGANLRLHWDVRIEEVSP